MAFVVQDEIVIDITPGPEAGPAPQLDTSSRSGKVQGKGPGGPLPQQRRMA